MDRHAIEQGLQKKGFRKSDRGHRCFRFHTQSGQQTCITTHTSHGSTYKHLGDHLVSSMAKQVGLTKARFEDLIECRLDAQGYEEILIANGRIKSGRNASD